MLETLSQVDKVFRDTTISYSAGEQFRVVADYWGIPYVHPTPEEYWREVVRSNAIAPRGVYGSVFLFVYWSLAQFNLSVPVSVSAANPDRITAITGTPFEQNHVGLLCMRNDTGEVFFVVGPGSIPGSSSYLTLATETAGPYWKAANFSADEEFSVSILPFNIVEEPAHVIIYVGSASVASSPGTYLQPDDSERPVGQPFGGHLQSDQAQYGDPLGDGPHPIYLSSGELFDEYSEVLRLLLVAGVRCTFRRMNYNG